MNGKKSVILLVLVLTFSSLQAVEVIRINQLGYLPESIKVAVYLSSEKRDVPAFSIHTALTGETVFSSETKRSSAETWGMKTACRLDFSEFQSSGSFYIKAGKTRSPDFRIDGNVYKGTADFILNYLRQQRCGYNPYLRASCHQHDGVIVDHPTRSGEKIDVTGGWHDASDYLQYSATSINTVFQMMFAFRKHPEIYGDEFNSRGEPGANQVPDILDEIRWGLEWMLKMNPAGAEMYNQIADDRDHVGYRLPNEDQADYGLGKSRPVYFVTGKPQGLSKYKNQSTGVSSIAGKFVSGFALGARVFRDSDPEFADLLEKKALDAWEFALSDIGFTQTVCHASPYFYEESNFADDLELAASQLFLMSGEQGYLEKAAEWGALEPVTPWMETGKAKHYQYYPFVNLGHYFLMQNGKQEFSQHYSEGLNYLFERGKDDPFFHGLPFIWCSNNLAAAALTQARLYAETTGDRKFEEMEASLRDWLFGCNPWGTAMICGLPGVEDSPMLPHSAFTVKLHETTYGGLVDGPVYSTVFNSLIGITLTKEDEYAPFNSGRAVYHDDIGDYSTNEPTLDGTASLSYYLAFLEASGRNQAHKAIDEGAKDEQGAIIRITPGEKEIYLVFTADREFEGGEFVLEVLNSHGIKGSFFFTGNFLRDPVRAEVISRIIKQGHYVGTHSDRHLLYCDWDDRDSNLVSFEEFRSDLQNNFAELEKFGVTRENAEFFLPPFEWYNRDIVGWSRKLGLKLISFTPGTGTNADYTSPGMKNYRSANQIFSSLEQFEEKSRDGLNGAILLIHPGTSPDRTDKFYRRLGDLIEFLSDKGYKFESLRR